MERVKKSERSEAFESVEWKEGGRENVVKPWLAKASLQQKRESVYVLCKRKRMSVGLERPKTHTHIHTHTHTTHTHTHTHTQCT